MAQVSAPAEFSIDLKRLKKDVLDLAQIGRDPDDHGIYRMAFNDADMEGKEWLCERISEAGLEPKRDGAGNISARLEGSDGGPVTYIGSHIDTVPCAGALDGSLGVTVGLEALRRLKEEGVKLKRPVELIAFSDEEGRFGGMFGSQAFAGMITPETLHQKDLDGIELFQAMKKQGMDPMAALDADRDPKGIHSYLELHIEQGPVLDRKGISVGIVDEITGLFKWNIKFRGEANHAGTTPMAMRRDAFMGLADFAHEIPRVLDECGTERSRSTVGKAQIIPGAPNTVPGLVEFSLDVRDTSEQVLEELKDAYRRVLQAIARRRKLTFEFDEISTLEPVQSAESLCQHLKQCAKALDLSFEVMPSGAAHDAQIMGQITDVAMIFVPSKNGISHSPEEWTAWNDIEAGANLALRTLQSVANG